MKRRLTYCCYVLITCVGMLVLAAAFTQTGIFRAVLRDAGVRFASQYIDGRLEIDGLRGSLFRDIGIEGVRLVHDGDTVLSLRRLYVSFNPWLLLEKRIAVHQLLIDGPSVMLRELPDGSWNVGQILLPADTEADTGTGFDWSVVIGKAAVTGGAAHILTQDSASAFPGRLQDVEVRLAGVWEQERGVLRLNFLRVTTEPTFPNIDSLRLSAVLQDNRITIHDLVLRTDRNTITGNGTVAIDTGRIRGHVEVRSFDTGDFDHWLGRRRIPVKPDIVADMQYDSSVVKGALAVTLGSTRITAVASLFNPEGDPEYTLELRSDGLRPDNLGVLPSSWNGNVINGTLSARGRGFDPATASAECSVELEASTIMGRTVHSALVEGSLRAGSLRSRAVVESDAGAFELDAGIRGILHEQGYTVSFDGRDIDLAKLTAIDTLRSALNVNARIEGRRWSAGSATGVVDVRLGSSLLMGDTISGAILAARYGKQTVTVDSCEIDASLLRLKGRGAFTLPGLVEGTIDVVLPDLARAGRLVHVDSLRGSLLMSVEASGRLDSLQAAVVLQGGQVGFGESIADSLQCTAMLAMADGIVAGSGSVAALGLEAAGFTADSLSIHGDTDSGSVQLDVRLSMPGEIALRGQANVRQGDSLLITLDRCAVDIGSEAAWRQEGPPTRIVLHEGSAGCSGITMAAGEQRISAAGMVYDGDSLNAELHIDSLLLSDVQQLYPMPVELSGRLSVDLRLAGTFLNPAAQTTVDVTALMIAGRLAGDATMKAELADSVLTYDVSVEGLLGNALLSEGSIPVHVSLRPAEARIDAHRDVQVSLRADRFDLSRIPSAMLPVDSVAGVLGGEIAVVGSLHDPSLNGSLRLSEAGVEWQRFGIQYRDMALVLRGENDRLLVDSLVIHAGNGTLRGEGVLLDGADLLNGEPGAASLRLTASDFALMQGKSMNAITDMDVTAGISGDSITYSGDVLISSSHLWLPVVMSRLSKQKEADLPLLLQAERNDEPSPADTLRRTAVPDRRTPEINGSVHVSIPRNSWVQSPDLNMLYEGELDVRHVHGEPRIAGYIKVYRGTYFFLGKKFSVESGRLDFREEAGLDPALKFEVIYRFRDMSREMSELQLEISGSASNPILRFTKNEEPVSESDAVSYVLFGRSASELSQGERNVVGNSTLDMAGNMLASRVTNQLGSALGFDVVELQGEDNWSRATFTAGKYLTDDLFVSYTKGFGEGDDNDINTETITLEYELTPFLIFRLTEGTSRHSGIDLIFRFD